MQEIDVEEVAGDFGVPTAKRVKPEECAEGTHQGRIVAAVNELKDFAFEKGAQYESLRLDVRILDEPTKPILKTWYTYSTTGIAPLLKILPEKARRGRRKSRTQRMASYGYRAAHGAPQGGSK